MKARDGISPGARSHWPAEASNMPQCLSGWEWKTPLHHCKPSMLRSPGNRSAGQWLRAPGDRATRTWSVKMWVTGRSCRRTPWDSHRNRYLIAFRKGLANPPARSKKRLRSRSIALASPVKILVVNDDGIYSPGLLALARSASHFGEVRIVAPDVEQSSMGHAVTYTRPLRYRRAGIEGFDAYKVDGTPADCVALGCHHWEKVDVVLSGINLGANLGNSTWHSGTLAAAKQATLLGVR